MIPRRDPEDCKSQGLAILSQGVRNDSGNKPPGQAPEADIGPEVAARRSPSSQAGDRP